MISFKKFISEAKIPHALDPNKKKCVAYEEAGAGEWGTPKLTKRYKKDTPGEGEKK